MYQEEKEEPPLDWTLNIGTEWGEEPSAPPAPAETKSKANKDEGFYPLRELKSAMGYSNPSYESPTQSSDENTEKDQERDITSKVPKDKERHEKEKGDQAQASTSLGAGRELKRGKGDEDRTDEIAFTQNEWMGCQTLLKLDGKGIEDMRQRGEHDELEGKEKEKEKRLRDEGVRKKIDRNESSYIMTSKSKKRKRRKNNENTIRSREQLITGKDRTKENRRRRTKNTGEENKKTKR
ncbi:uncharacterized protein [Ambystoma mexicanum]|uniref:uncharacterized protein n=1 Tax=Ambystoma mexicanum TaxID=8296 RepID=UPI0037E94BFE